MRSKIPKVSNSSIEHKHTKSWLIMKKNPDKIANNKYIKHKIENERLSNTNTELFRCKNEMNLLKVKKNVLQYFKIFRHVSL